MANNWILGASALAALGIFLFAATSNWHGAEVRLVPVINSDAVLDLIAQGKTVVFVDAREAEEFAEQHIPGAINLTLRDLSSLDRSLLGSPDLVIAYCLKDFRGFELARALSQNPELRVATLTEMGINGWKARGLPVVEGDRSERLALEALLRCASRRATCTAAQ